MKTVPFRLSPGKDLRSSLLKMAQDEHIGAGVILTGVGSLLKACIRPAGKKEADYLQGPFEILAISGTISSQDMNVKITLSGPDGLAFGGHLMKGCEIYTTAEIAIGIIEDTRFERILDNRTGHRELHITRTSDDGDEVG